MKFYEDQHKLAAYLERTGAAFEVKSYGVIAVWISPGCPRASEYLGRMEIRPLLRYGLPSHLQSEIHNPDNLTEEQICEGGKYRAVTKRDSSNQNHEGWAGEKWFIGCVCESAFENYSITYRLPATVPWPDWEREEAAQPAYKETSVEAEIAACELLIGSHEATIKKLEAQLATFPWRRMSEVPTEEDADADGFILGVRKDKTIGLIKRVHFKAHVASKSFLAWMPTPKFHGWPDPLADLLKAHGVEATQELTAALNAWKGVGE